MEVPKRLTYELLRRYIIEPVSERSICAAEAFLIMIYRILVILVVIWSSCASHVNEIRQWVLTTALPIVYRGHRASLLNFLGLIFRVDKIERHHLEINQGVAFLFDVASVRWLI